MILDTYLAQPQWAPETYEMQKVRPVPAVYIEPNVSLLGDLQRHLVGVLFCTDAGFWVSAHVG